MKESHFKANLMLIRSVWGMNRQQIGKQLSCTTNQIGNLERGTSAITPSVLFDLEELTGITAKRLYYEILTRTNIPNQPLMQTSANENAPPQSRESRDVPYKTENLSVEERLKRLETKVFV
jgi:transcriptional regulator with XRE-family HTH domain